MDKERKTIYLCLAHMSDDKMEEKYVQEAFDTNWVVPLGPNVNAFEEELKKFVNSRTTCLTPDPSRNHCLTPDPSPEERGESPYKTADPVLYKQLKEYSKEMRNNPTDAESAAWNLLRGKNVGAKFRRQHIIGDYIVDFVCLECQLVVEIDGEYHNEWEQHVNDEHRTAWLENAGFRVIRFTNSEVLATPDIFIEKVKQSLKTSPTGGGQEGASSSPTGGGQEGAMGAVVALSAGTAAVHLALLACGIKSGDEVCVQSFTFCASSHPITYLGAKPVFIGSEKDTWNMDPELLEKAIIDRKAKTGKYPKAIIPVALYGMPYQIDKIMAIANRYNIPVIEDAAEGLGSRYNGQVLGTFGRFGVLSFNGNKMITTSGGGALVCNGLRGSKVSEDSELKPLKQHETTETKTETNNETTETTPADDAQTVMWLATQARDAYPYYQHSTIGYNYRMSNVCAGIGRGQMMVLEQHIRHHQHVCQLYSELLKDVEGITLHLAPNEDFSMLNSQLSTLNFTKATTGSALPPSTHQFASKVRNVHTKRWLKPQSVAQQV